MKKLIIIGGGIAGLSAGIFAQVNGFESVILEKHHTSGGECTGWDRRGYHIDGCIHWLVGTKEGTPLRQLWDTTGALDGVDIYHPESFMVVEHNETTVHFYRNLDRMQASWLEISPDDKHPIESFCADIRKLQSFQIPVDKPMDLMSVFEKIRFMLSMKEIGPVLQKYDKLSVQDLAMKFKHPALRAAIDSFMPEGEYRASSVLFPLGTFTGDQSSIPAGGSKALAMRMTAKYIALGGQIETTCEVTGLDIQSKRVQRLHCRNGRSFAADYVIAACDANELYEQILAGNYPDPAYRMRFDDPARYPLASNIYVGIGYQGKMDEIPRSLKFPVESLGINQNGKPVEYLQMTHYAYEPDFAPAGHTVLTVAINQFEPELKAWETLARDKTAYEQKKADIGAAVIQAIETRFPHMTGHLSLLDVATPQTYQHYCNAYRGAFMGFWPTLSGKTLTHTGRVKGLDNMMLSGQWLQPPGGLPTAVITGKDSIMRLCKQEKKAFICS